jgi:hypothetical protein
MGTSSAEIMQLILQFMGDFSTHGVPTVIYRVHVDNIIFFGDSKDDLNRVSDKFVFHSSARILLR